MIDTLVKPVIHDHFSWFFKWHLKMILWIKKKWWKITKKKILFIKRKTSGTSSDNEWQQMTTSGNEWQRVVQRVVQRVTVSGTTSDNEWCNKWQRVTMSKTTSDNK